MFSRCLIMMTSLMVSQSVKDFPYDRKSEKLYIERTLDDEVIILFPEGDSFKIPLETAKLYIERFLGGSKHVLDYLWNFKRIWFLPKEGRYYMDKPRTWRVENEITGRVIPFYTRR